MDLDSDSDFSRSGPFTFFMLEGEKLGPVQELAAAR
jgi:hypothetical protein